MSNFIVEEERGTYTGRRHPSNGYYAFTGPVARTSGPRFLATTPHTLRVESRNVAAERMHAS